MGKNNNIIEINGISYDAKTGAAFGHPAQSQQKAAAKPIKTTVKHTTMSDVVRQPAKPAAKRTPKPSGTLMRRSVKKPVPIKPKHSKAQGQISSVAKQSAHGVVAKRSASRVDNKLLVKARRIPQSRLIKHFSPITSDSNKYAPAAIPISLPATLGTGSKMPNPKKPSNNVKPQTTAELLDHALRHATSHEQETPPAKAKKRRGLRVATGTAAVLILIGIVGSQQLPNLRLHMASAKAGFHASMPDYKPAGYSAGNLVYSSGVVSATYSSNSDQRKYTLTQKASNWDSQALLDNFVAVHDKNYQTVSDSGRTIYIYGNHNATWVNAGVWYIIQSDGSLTNNQLIQLASSL